MSESKRIRLPGWTAWTLAAATLAGCDGAATTVTAPPRFVLLVVGDPAAMNASERALHDRLGGLGRPLVVRDDDGISPADANGCALVVMSKTVDSNKIGARIKGASCGVVFWEDNQQMVHMLATIDNDGSGGTDWHATEDDVHVRPDAPASLRAGLSGERDFYVRLDEITFAPRGDLIADAIVVAEFDEAGGDPAIYAIERGARLADGSRAAGRRVFFGLYDDTFRLLTLDGLALFDAAIAWALDSPAPGSHRDPRTAAALASTKYSSHVPIPRSLSPASARR